MKVLSSFKQTKIETLRTMYQHIRMKGENFIIFTQNLRGEKLHHNKKILEAKWRRKFMFLMHSMEWKRDEEGARLTPQTQKQFYFCLKLLPFAHDIYLGQ